MCRAESYSIRIECRSHIAPKLMAQDCASHVQPKSHHDPKQISTDIDSIVGNYDK